MHTPDSDKAHPRPARVLHITVAPVLGGLQRVLWALAQDQRRHGLEVYVVTSPGGPLGSTLRDDGFEVHESFLDRGLKLASVISLRRFARTHAVDLVHAHGARASLYAYLATRGHDIRLISHVHATDPWRFNGSMRARIDRFVAKRADLVVACSQELRTQLISRQGLPPEHTICIPNGIDVWRYQRVRPARSGGVFVIGTCARLEQQKGLSYLIDALGLLKTRMPSVQLVVAGSGSLAASLQERARLHGVEDRVSWLGFQQDIPGVLAGLDLFVLPSLTEGLPLALLEAMAAGVPVLATEISGVTELLRHGETGMLVPPRSPEALADAIHEISTHPGASQRRAAMALAFVAEHHGQDRMMNAFRDLYSALLEPSMPLTL